jgi:cell division protein FtsL
MVNKIKIVIFIVILLAIFISAMKLIIVRYESRILFGKLQNIQEQQYILETELGKLQLEHGTWSNLKRIETIAEKSLDMHKPNIEN